MAKLPFIKFYHADWKKDTKLRKCSANARGVWIELLIAMHEEEQQGTITGTIEELAKICGYSEKELLDGLVELQDKGAANVTPALHSRYGVTVNNEPVTVENRRMRREAKARTSGAYRAKKYRASRKSNGTVTGDISEVRFQKSDYNTLSSVTPSNENFYETDTEQKKQTGSGAEEKKYPEWAQTQTGNTGGPPDTFFTDFDQLGKVMSEQFRWIEQGFLIRGMSRKQFDQALADFILHLKGTQDGERKSLRDAKTHFTNWISKRGQSGNSAQNTTSTYKMGNPPKVD